MLSKVTNSLAHVLVSDSLSDYKLESRKFRGGKNNLLHIQDAVEISSKKFVSIVSVDVREIISRCNTENEARYTLEILKEGISLLTRLRHPGILQVIKPLVENKKYLRFVTERISSLLTFDILNGNISKQEKLLGIFRCSKVLEFIHERVGYLLCDFSPQAVCIVEGEWKIFDFSHAFSALKSSQLNWIYPLSSISAPLIDYCSTEILKTFKIKNDGPIDLFVSNSDNLKVKIPDSDVFSFIIFSTEVLSGSKVFNCGDNIELHDRQFSNVEREVSKWFSGSPLSIPRPSLDKLRKDKNFSTEDMLILIDLDEYDTMDENMRFNILKKLYDGLGNFIFEEVIIVKLIIPLMRRESLQENRLRYTIPILLQCCPCVSKMVFTTYLREFFIAILTGITTSNSFERCGVVAELILEKFKLLVNHFNSDSDKNNIVIPFLERCVNPINGVSKVTRVAIDQFIQLTENGENLSFSDTLPEKLIDLSIIDTENFTHIFICLERVIKYASFEARQLTESRLIQCINTLIFNAVDMSKFFGTSLALLERLYEGFSREHKATRSIPLISPLLLSSSSQVSSFSKRMIEKMVIEVTVMSTTDDNNLNHSPTLTQKSFSYMETDMFSF